MAQDWQSNVSWGDSGGDDDSGSDSGSDGGSSGGDSGSSSDGGSSDRGANTTDVSSSARRAFSGAGSSGGSSDSDGGGGGGSDSSGGSGGSSGGGSSGSSGGGGISGNPADRLSGGTENEPVDSGSSDSSGGSGGSGGGSSGSSGDGGISGNPAERLSGGTENEPVDSGGSSDSPAQTPKGNPPDPDQGPDGTSDTAGPTIPGAEPSDLSLAEREAQRAREELATQFSQRSDDATFSRENVRLVGTEDGKVRGALTKDTRETLRSVQAASAFSRILDRDIQSGDVQVTDDGATLSKEAKREVRSERLSESPVSPADRELVRGQMRAKQRQQRREGLQDADRELVRGEKRAQKRQRAQELEQRARQERRRARDLGLQAEQVLDDETTVQATGTPIQTTQSPTTGGFAQTTEPETGPTEELLQPVIGPPGETERAVGGAVEGAAQPVLGPPGTVEGAIGSGVYAVGDVSSQAANATQQEVVSPAANVTGAGIGQLQTITARPDLVQESVESGEVQTDESVERSVENLASGVGAGGTELIRSPQTAITASELVGSSAEFTAEQVSEEGIEEGAETAIDAGGDVAATAAESAIQQAQERPFETTGTVIGGYIVGAGISRGVGKVARGAQRRARVAGAETIDESDLSQESVIRGEDEFSGALDEENYLENPTQQVRQQASEMTADELEQAFRDAGIDDPTVLKKALPVEPAGPKRARAAQGFKSAVEPDDETGIDPADITEEQIASYKDSPGEFSYENPGSFVSTDLSRYFLGDVERSGTDFSLRPGLPSVTTDQSTVAAIATRVRSPDADTQLEYARELARREGETDAFTKPKGSKDLNPGEIEATIPAGAEFADIGTGPVRDALRRAGIGADYAVDVGGTKVPIRAVAPESDLDAGSRDLTGVVRDRRGQVGATAGRGRVTRQFDDRRRGQADADATDNVTPVPASPPTDADADEPSETVATGGSSDDGTSTPDRDGSSQRPLDSGSNGANGGLGIGGSVGGFGGPITTDIGGGVGTPSGDSGGSTGGPTGGGGGGGGSTGDTSDGSSGGGGGGSSGGSTGGFDIPGTTTQTRNRRGDDPDDENEDIVVPRFGGARQGIFTDFRNPLTGATVQTESKDVPTEPEQPVFLGFDSE